MGVRVKGFHQLVDLVGDGLDVDESAQLPSVDLDALDLVDGEDDELGEVPGEGADDHGRADARHQDDLRLVVGLRRSQADAGDVLRSEGHGAGDSFHRGDDALVDGERLRTGRLPDVSYESLFRLHGYLSL